MADVLENCDRFIRINCIERLQNVEYKNRIDGITKGNNKVNVYFTNLDYREVKIKPRSIIYCDIPYKGTDNSYSFTKKKDTFDHEAFYQWAESQNQLVFISEYNMP